MQLKWKTSSAIKLQLGVFVDLQPIEDATF